MATTKVSTKLLETVGVAEGGTGATSTSAARTALGLVIGTNVLAPGGSGSSLTGIATGATDAEAANIMLNAFRISVNGGLSVQNMVDGVVDEFEDETGVDTSTSTNETYNATDDLYSNPGSVTTSSSSGEWTGATGSFTFSGDDIDANSNVKAIKSVDTFTGDFEMTCTYGTGATNERWGVYEIAEDSTFSSTSQHGGLYSMTHSWVFENGVDFTYGGSSEQAITDVGANSTIKIERISGVIKIYEDATLLGTFAVSRNNEVRMFCGTGNQSGTSWKDYTWTDNNATPNNMTLFSNASTALAAPDDANIVIWQEDVDSVTLNTDLKAYASRNGGTTYTQMTLAEVANLTTGRILTGTVDISGQSSATAMKYKIETLNTKSQKIHAVALQWS